MREDRTALVATSTFGGKRPVVRPSVGGWIILLGDWWWLCSEDGSQGMVSYRGV